MAAVLVLAAAGGPAWALAGEGASAAATPAWTISHYEQNARPATLYRQGVAAGRAAAQGIVILDFGRPAARGRREGTVAYDGAFVPLASVSTAVEAYVRGYFRAAPADTSLYVAVGTNNSCGTGQPCGSVVCGCREEPPSFLAWGEHLASTVEHVGAWTARLRLARGYTDDVRVVAADDVEPAFDPGYRNTYDVLRGYALAVRGSVPAMVDFGSADPHVWTEARLYQVAYGFPPDVPMPQIYYPHQAGEWAALLRYVRRHLNRRMTIFGVLAGGAGTSAPPRAYADLLGAVDTVSPQQGIRWRSTMAPLVYRGRGAHVG